MFEAYFSLILFSFFLLGSPGPAPLAIAATGATFGISKGFKFLLGLVIGFVGVVSVQGVAIYFLLGHSQIWVYVLQLFGFVYVLYLALRIARAPINVSESSSVAAPSWIDGLILNISNPKAYAAMTAVYAQFLLPHESTNVAYLMTALVCIWVVIIIDLIWLLLGRLIRPYMQDQRTGRFLRVGFAVAMVVMVLWVLINNF